MLSTPADFAALKQRDLSGTLCVVFDVLRATTSMITALAHGATAILPVEEIAEALSARRNLAGALLAGERDGVRITAELTGSVAFDLGNSPREFAPGIVGGKTIIMTTTNGTRALRACAGARMVLAASFLNLGATAKFIRQQQAADLLVVCSGTFEQAAYEDALAAGALCDLLWPEYSSGAAADSAFMARQLFQHASQDLAGALSASRNGRRLLSRPDLQDDVAFCAQRDLFELVAVLGKNQLLEAATEVTPPTFAT